MINLKPISYLSLMETQPKLCGVNVWMKSMTIWRTVCDYPWKISNPSAPVLHTIKADIW